MKGTVHYKHHLMTTKFYGSKTWSITCIIPLVVTISVAVIFEGVVLALPFTVAPLVNPMVTFPPFTVAG